MILAELITNACRHAFADSGGSIKVEFERRGFGSNAAWLNGTVKTNSVTPRSALWLISPLRWKQDRKTVVARTSTASAKSAAMAPPKKRDRLGHRFRRRREEP
jgi:two-component sensor histidine kinase